ncbi:hypothetical protein [Streptomyces sp. NPDC091217]|uniref:hypothetical protein n=1 Tax=Streptomyces sp. NPDC091217 TaxID=3365975 RepID=UPI003804EBFC
MVDRARWLGDVAADVGRGDSGLAAEHRDDRRVDAVLGDLAGAVGEQEVRQLAGLVVEHLRLGGSDGLPCLDGLAQKRVDGLGERGADLVAEDVQ